jgi:predicted lysophospholipase L1 biosynthesis ABC-type transport system permease subunit
MQHPVRGATYVVRSGGDPAQLSNLARAAVGSAAPNLPVYDMRTLSEHIRLETAGDMIMAKLLGTFGAMALLLSLIGVYGVMAYTVAQRERELGIRRVLGARVKDISWLVLSGGLRVAGLGAGIGLLIALGVTRTLSTFLQGVSAFDPVVFTGVTLALVAAALAATTVRRGGPRRWIRGGAARGVVASHESRRPYQAPLATRDCGFATETVYSGLPEPETPIA